MTMTLAEARNALGKKIAEAEAVLKLKDILDTAAAAESAAANAEQRLAELEAQIAPHAAAVEQAKAELAEAKEQTSHILRQARVDAGAIVDKAKAEARAALDAAAEQVKAADDVLAAKGNEHADLTAQVDAKRVELGEVEAKLVAAQEAVRKMLGGGNAP